MYLFSFLSYLNVFNISIFIFSLVFFYLYIKSLDKYLGYWGLSWLLYGTGITVESCLIQTMPFFSVFFQQFTFLFSSILLLKGIYSFLNKKMHWAWFSPLIFTLALLPLASEVPISNNTVLLIPLAVLCSAITVYTGIVFLQNWPIEGKEKLFTGIMIIVWGIHKSYYLYLNPNFIYSQYLTELILFIVLGISMFLLCLQKNHQMVIRNEKIFRLLAENSPNIIYLYTNNPSPSYDYISPNVTTILGYSQDDFYNDPKFINKIVHPEDRSLLDLSSIPNLNPNSCIAIRYKNKEGKYLWFEEYATHIYDSNDQLYGIEGFLRDITSSKEHIKKAKINEKDRQRLLYSISHELKTPLTAIRGNIETIRDNKIPPGENIEKYLSNAYNKTRLLERLVNDLFELSQLESNQFSFNFSVIKFNEFFPDVFDKIAQDVTKEDLDFKLHIDHVLYNCKYDFLMDIERIEQVLYNIINNSIKNTKPGDCISVTCLYSNNYYISINITDNGKGISKNTLPYIFDMFYKDPDSKVRGSGLGLAISKEILLKHNATIKVESELDVGTTFTIEYPFLKE